MIDLKKLKLCPKCNLKLYNLYNQITIHYTSKDDIKRKWQFIGKICKNRHHFIDESKIEFNNYKFKVPIYERVIYLKITLNHKQKFKRIGFIDDLYRIFFDDIYLRYEYYKIHIYTNKNGLPEIFFHYPIEKREKIQYLKIFDIKYGIEKRISKSKDFDIKN